MSNSTYWVMAEGQLNNALLDYERELQKKGYNSLTIKLMVAGAKYFFYSDAARKNGFTKEAL